jgi:hypothetical protein
MARKRSGAWPWDVGQARPQGAHDFDVGIGGGFVGAPEGDFVGENGGVAVVKPLVDRKLAGGESPRHRNSPLIGLAEPAGGRFYVLARKGWKLQLPLSDAPYGPSASKPSPYVFGSASEVSSARPSSSIRSMSSRLKCGSLPATRLGKAKRCARTIPQAARYSVST